MVAYKKNYLLGAVRALLLIGWIISMPLVFLLARMLRIKSHTKLPHIFHRGTCKIIGIRVTCSGEMSTIKPTLWVSNHVSYIDIFVLGFIPAFFIAKSEVASWPLFGQLARFQNTLFIERKAGRAKDQLHILRNHLLQNNSLILFPEGTSTDGVHVEPFKSTLFAAADLRVAVSSGVEPESANTANDQPEKIAIQPITVCYTHYDGKKINEQELRDCFAWYAKMPFLPHFLNLFSLKKVDAKVHFHPVCYIEQFDSRKACAEHCHQQVAQKLQQLVS